MFSQTEFFFHYLIQEFKRKLRKRNSYISIARKQLLSHSNVHFYINFNLNWTFSFEFLETEDFTENTE